MKKINSRRIIKRGEFQSHAGGRNLGLPQPNSLYNIVYIKPRVIPAARALNPEIVL